MPDIALVSILGKDPKKCSPEEIQEAINRIEALKVDAQVEKGRADRREERRKNQLKRAQYQLAAPVNYTDYNRHAILDKILAHFENAEVLTHPQFDEILRPHTFHPYTPMEKVYPCPECGELALDYGRDHGGKIRVKCFSSACEWECPKWARTKTDAEEVFVKWLTDQRFIGPNKPKLEDIVK